MIGRHALLRRYILYLRLPRVRNLLVAKSGKVAITNINQGSIRSLPVCIPGLPEQHEIASILETCDAKLGGLQSEMALLDELFRAMLEELMARQLSAMPLIDEGQSQ